MTSIMFKRYISIPFDIEVHTYIHPHGLSQDLERGCPKLAIVKNSHFLAHY